MKVCIDADGCPVVNETISVCRKFGIKCVIICDTAHTIEREGAETIVVEKGADSVDFKIVNLLESGDIAVTQDYALAAMCLSRNAAVINQNGLEYTSLNIDGLLFSRFMSKKIRAAGGRLKGPPKRDKRMNEIFSEKLEEMIKSKLGEI